MREEAVNITFTRTGRFLNKIRSGGFSFPAMICKYTSDRAGQPGRLEVVRAGVRQCPGSKKRTFSNVRRISALPPKADIRNGSDRVRRSSSGSLALFAAIRRCHAGCTPGVVSLMSSLAGTKERSNAASIRCNKHSHPDQRDKSERHKRGPRH